MGNIKEYRKVIEEVITFAEDTKKMINDLENSDFKSSLKRDIDDISNGLESIKATVDLIGRKQESKDPKKLTSYIKKKIDAVLEVAKLASRVHSYSKLEEFKSNVSESPRGKGGEEGGERQGEPESRVVEVVDNAEKETGATEEQIRNEYNQEQEQKKEAENAAKDVENEKQEIEHSEEGGHEGGNDEAHGGGEEGNATPHEEMGRSNATSSSGREMTKEEKRIKKKKGEGEVLKRRVEAYLKSLKDDKHSLKGLRGRIKGYNKTKKHLNKYFNKLIKDIQDKLGKRFSTLNEYIDSFEDYTKSLKDRENLDKGYLKEVENFVEKFENNYAYIITSDGYSTGSLPFFMKKVEEILKELDEIWKFHNILQQNEQEIKNLDTNGLISTINNYNITPDQNSIKWALNESIRPEVLIKYDRNFNNLMENLEKFRLEILREVSQKK